MRRPKFFGDHFPCVADRPKIKCSELRDWAVESERQREIREKIGLHLFGDIPGKARPITHAEILRMLDTIERLEDYGLV